MKYCGSCHCGAVRFTFESEPITSGIRCNCSICARRGAVMSSSYLRGADVAVEGADALVGYQFGDRSMTHHHCRHCGITPFSRVADLPLGYGGAARVGDYRVNLGCVANVDPFALDVRVIDGRSM